MSAYIRTRRFFATGLAVVLTGGGLASIAAPAQAAVTATYTCTGGGQVFNLPVDIDTDAPARLFVGDSLAPKVTATSALPGSLAKQLKDAGAETVEGTATAKGAVNGTAWSVSQTIPSTPLGVQMTPTNVPFTATGTALPMKLASPVDHVITAGDIDVTFTFRRADGTVVGGPIAANCKAPTGPAPVIDTVVVVAKSSTVLTVSPASVGFGAPVTATAKVTTTGGTPEGEVTFVVDGVSTKVLVKDGVASLEIKQGALGTNPVSATFTPKDIAHFEGSSAAPVSFQVTKAATSTKVKIIGKRVGELTSTTIKVVGINKTVPTGKVKLVLRKVGNKGFLLAKQGKLGKGSRGFRLGRLGKGTYKIAVKYLGDNFHNRSKTVKRFRVIR